MPSDTNYMGQNAAVMRSTNRAFKCVKRYSGDWHKPVRIIIIIIIVMIMRYDFDSCDSVIVPAFLPEVHFSQQTTHHCRGR
jgi:hypothetical protein